jgi:hypothetical protein
MAYQVRSLISMIHDIEASHLLLPHIQRPFVWEEDQMRRLLDSLLQGYPIQTFLFWKTQQGIRARRFMQTIDRDAELHELYDRTRSQEGVEKLFVLDGQQRLQTLYALFRGALAGRDAKPLAAWLDLASGEDERTDGFRYDVRFALDAPGPSFYRLADLASVDQARHPPSLVRQVVRPRCVELLKEMDEDARDRFDERVLDTVSRLRSLLFEDRYFWGETLDDSAGQFPYHRVLDIFVRVNSGGTRLSAADLMFAAMKEGWDAVEEKIEDVVDLLNHTDRLAFDKTFVLKCLAVTFGQGAELTPSLFGSSKGQTLLQDIERRWSECEATFQQLRDFVRGDLRIASDRLVASYNSLVPVFEYLFHNPRPGPTTRRLVAAYFHKAQLFNWFGSRTDSILNGLHGIVGTRQSEFPLDAIKVWFAARGYEVSVAPSHLDKPRVRSLLLNIVYVERFGLSPFDVKYRENEPQVDHIYPQSMLRSRLGLSSSEINHVGNFRFVGASDNNRKRAQLPAAYFAELRAAGVPIEDHLLIKSFADDPTKLTFDAPTYQTFRDQRAAEIHRIIRAAVEPELIGAAVASEGAA